MFAIAFDMQIKNLCEYYEGKYPNAYYEIRQILESYTFYNTQGSVYLSTNNDIGNLYKAIDSLKKIEWFRKSVRDIRVFRVEDWSNFTEIIKENT